LDPKGYPYLEGIAFSAKSDHVIEAITQTPNKDVPMNLSYAQLIIHNVGEEYNYTEIDSCDFAGMYKVVEFSPRLWQLFSEQAL